MIRDIEFRWGYVAGWQTACGSTPDLQYRVQRDELVEELSGDGYRSRIRHVWSDWMTVQHYHQTDAAGDGESGK